MLARIFAFNKTNKQTMAKTKNSIPAGETDKKTHSGYNEKNPTQPQGAFKADSMETKSNTPVKKSNKNILKK